MISASLYIIACGIRNRARRSLVRLREPRYLGFAIAGAIYLCLMAFLRLKTIGFGAAVGGGSSPLDALPVLAPSGTTLAGFVLLMAAAVSWLIPGGGGLLELTRAEIQFLFPAPVSRRRLVAYRMLRSQLGDSAFFGGLRAYYAAHKNGNADSDDLRAALERSSGQPLDAFFQQWLRRPGYPIVEVGLLMTRESRLPRIEVEQSSEYGYFDFPLEVVVADSSGHISTQVVHVLPQPVTRVDVATPADHIADVDPKVKILARISYGTE